MAKAIKVRTSPEHHGRLVEASKREGVSLQQYILYLLSVATAEDTEDGFTDLFSMQSEEINVSS